MLKFASPATKSRVRRLNRLPLALAVCLAVPVAAQSRDTPPIRKDTVVVTGTWEPLPLEEADRAVTVTPIRGQDLLFNSFVDVLKLDPSIDVRQRAPNGVQADVSVRGATFAQALVLLNGRRVNDPQSGHHNLDLPVPLEGLETMETLRGSGSTLYGSDALGGVVQFRAVPPESTEIKLRGALGNFGVNQERVSAALVRGRLMEHLTASRDFSTGFAPGRDYRNLSAWSATQWKSKTGVTAVDLGYADKPFGADQFYGNYNSWERTKTWFAGARQTFGQAAEAAFSYRRHSDLFILYRDRPQVFRNDHIGESWQASLRRQDRVKAASIYYGLEGYGDDVDSTNLGRHSRQRAAGYLATDFRTLGRFSLSAGLRTESYRGIFDQVSPSISGGYWFSRGLKARASVSRAFRLPTYTDLFYHDPGNVGNPNLRAETAWNYEGGVEWRPSPRSRIEAALFRREDRDVIDYVRAGPADVWRATNFQHLSFTGFEGGVSLRWKASVIDMRYTGLRGISQAIQGFQSKYVFNYPIHSGIVSWQGNYRGVAARTRLGVIERKGRDPYAVWDIYGARAAGKLRPFLQLTNLTGASYQEVIGVAMPGFGIVGGVEWTVFR